MLKIPSRKARAPHGRHAGDPIGWRRAAFRLFSNPVSLGVTVLILATAAALIGGTIASPSATSVMPQANWSGTVTVDTSGTSVGSLNDHYIGLSFGTNELNTGQLDNVKDLTTLLKNLGTGVIRFGGIVADQDFSEITPQALVGLTRLVKASGWTVLYTENIGQFNAESVVASAKAVSKALGNGLSAFACGNEPEYFYNDGLRSKNYSVGDYLGDADNCIEAIDTGVPNAAIEGPDTVTEPTWPAAYATSEAGLIKWFGVHFYPLPCGLDGESPSERAMQLFTPSQIAREVWWFGWAKADAEIAEANLWMTEVNTACGGGDPGLSDSFASALWIIDYLLLGAEHGVSGMNIQGGLGTCAGRYPGYSPLCEVSANEYAAEPIYYGMLLTHMLGTGTLLPVKVSSNGSPGNIVAFALRSSTGGIRMIIENFSPKQAVIKLEASVPTSHAAVMHLTAPSLLATSGIEIQGATVGADGVLRPGKADTGNCSAYECPVTLAPYSAALVDWSQ